MVVILEQKIPFLPIRLRKWTSSEELQGKQGTKSCMPQKY